ncbi:MAG: glutamate-5-semialdehyde dehydrogenase [Candidatus Omnitrophica bacterium]|nr:glutamate-5-semialdehyde dehydrogenase [Candidatus Omnitrophota bacterium]
MTDVRESVHHLAARARAASRLGRRLSTTQKNDVLLTCARLIEERLPDLRKENALDLEAGRGHGLSSAMLDRLTLSDKTVRAMTEGLREVAALPDPVYEITHAWRRPNGLEIARMQVPLGVIAIIYESRPNVTIDAAALCFKAGNATILRGGSEAFYSNRALTQVFREACSVHSVEPDVVQSLETTDREAVGALLKLDSLIDVVIPRGGRSLIERVVEESRIPVIKHYDGICHVYVDRDADLDMADEIVFNAKVQRPGVCNAMETLLVHEAVADSFLPGALKRLAAAGVELRVDERTRRAAQGQGIELKPVTEEDWRTEYLELILSVAVVPDLEAAIDHIETYGSHHTDTIVTRSWEAARRFQMEVDSSTVLVNASTRFSDGQQFGLGAEIGISTDKLHARGPMGLTDLVCKKFVVSGNGQIRT